MVAPLPFFLSIWETQSIPIHCSCLKCLLWRTKARAKSWELNPDLLPWMGETQGFEPSPGASQVHISKKLELGAEPRFRMIKLQASIWALWYWLSASFVAVYLNPDYNWIVQLLIEDLTEVLCRYLGRSIPCRGSRTVKAWDRSVPSIQEQLRWGKRGPTLWGGCSAAVCDTRLWPG